MRGRRPRGPECVTPLPGSATAKERLQVVLEVIAGRTHIVEACAKLQVSEARFYQLKHEALTGALAALEPGQAGRHVCRRRPGAWTSDDVAAACLEANATARPQGERGPTPEAQRDQRPGLTPEQRARFQASLQWQRARVNAKEQIAPGTRGNASNAVWIIASALIWTSVQSCHFLRTWAAISGGTHGCYDSRGFDQEARSEAGGSQGYRQ